MKHAQLITLTTFVITTLIGEINTQAYGQINYLDCPPPPEDSVVIFAEGIVSLNNRGEEKICFTSDGEELFFGIHPFPNKYFHPFVLHSKFENNHWSKPDTVLFSKNRLLGWPVLSLNGTTLFMEEVVRKSPKGVICQIVYTKKDNGGWSPIDTISPEVEGIEGFGLAQITNDSTLYFYSRYERVAYYSNLVNGKYSTPVPLSYRINPAVEFFVSPQHDYIIFKPIHWYANFHISYREGENEWSMPIPISSYFNKKKSWDGKGYGPYVSPDNKYFFFGKQGDIYWVKTDFIDALRNEL